MFISSLRNYMIGMAAALEHAYGFYPRENVLASGSMLDGTLSRLHVDSTTGNGKEGRMPRTFGPSALGRFLQSFLSRYLLPALKGNYHRWKKLSSAASPLHWEFASFRVVAARYLTWRCRACGWWMPLCFW